MSLQLHRLDPTARHKLARSWAAPHEQPDLLERFLLSPPQTARRLACLSPHALRALLDASEATSAHIPRRSLNPEYADAWARLCLIAPLQDEPWITLPDEVALAALDVGHGAPSRLSLRLQQLDAGSLERIHAAWTALSPGLLPPNAVPARAHDLEAWLSDPDLVPRLLRALPGVESSFFRDVESMGGWIKPKDWAVMGHLPPWRRLVELGLLWPSAEHGALIAVETLRAMHTKQLQRAYSGASLQSFAWELHTQPTTPIRTPRFAPSPTPSDAELDALKVVLGRYAGAPPWSEEPQPYPAPHRAPRPKHTQLSESAPKLVAAYLRQSASRVTPWMVWPWRFVADCAHAWAQFAASVELFVGDPYARPRASCNNNEDAARTWAWLALGDALEIEPPPDHPYPKHLSSLLEAYIDASEGDALLPPEAIKALEHLRPRAAPPMGGATWKDAHRDAPSHLQHTLLAWMRNLGTTPESCPADLSQEDWKLFRFFGLAPWQTPQPLLRPEEQEALDWLLRWSRNTGAPLQIDPTVLLTTPPRR